VIELALRPAWMRQALCRNTDADLWHPQRGRNPATVLRNVCRACPVRTDCAAYAVSLGRECQGFWAAMSYKERTRLRARGRVLVGDDELTYDRTTGNVEVVTVGPTLDPATALAQLAAWPELSVARSA
jgi:hypothetical protein